MITVVGAGPAGNFTAYLLAKAGLDVQVVEEHKAIGEPVACTGVITGDVLAKRLQLPKNLIVNRIAKARIISPSKASIEVMLKNDIIIDRAGFDRCLAGMAQDAGAGYFTSHRFEGIEHSQGRVVAVVKNKTRSRTKKLEADYLVGADGPLSAVAKAAGLFGTRRFYVGLQATVKIENDNVIDFYPSEDGIAWVVPENEKVARVGIAAKTSANNYFRKFLTAVAGKDYEKKIIARQAGPIPVYAPRLRTATKDRKILLVGDAATMVKATTLGGINQGMIGAEAVAESITKNADYEKVWKRKMGTDLYLSLLMRKAMEHFSNDNYNALVETFRKGKNREIIENYDRDEPRKFALKLMVREPELLLFARKIWF